MPTLAPTMFTGGIDEKLAVFDVYGLDGQAVLTDVSAVDTFTEYYQGGSEGGTSLIPDLPALAVSGALDAISQTASLVEGNLSSMATGLSGMVSDAAGGAMSTLTTSLNEVKAAVEVDINGLKSTISALPTAQISGMIGTVGALANTSIQGVVNDVASKVTLATNTLNKATAAGMSGLFSAVATSSQFAGAPLNSIVKGISNTVAMTSNTKVLGEIASFPAAASALNFSTPNFSGNFLQNYKAGTTSIKSLGANLNSSLNQVKGIQKNLTNNYSQIKGSLTQINSNLLTGVRNAKQVLSAANLKKMSADAKKMVKANLINTVLTTSPATALMSVKNVVASLSIPPIPPAEAFILPAVGMASSSVTSILAAENATMSYFA
jgi:hypothetical protein